MAPFPPGAARKPLHRDLFASGAPVFMPLLLRNNGRESAPRLRLSAPCFDGWELVQWTQASAQAQLESLGANPAVDFAP